MRRTVVMRRTWVERLEVEIPEGRDGEHHATTAANMHPAPGEARGSISIALEVKRKSFACIGSEAEVVVRP